MPAGRSKRYELLIAHQHAIPARSEMAGTLSETIVVNDPAAVCEAGRLGLGVSLIALVDVLPELEGSVTSRADWNASGGLNVLFPHVLKALSADWDAEPAEPCVKTGPGLLDWFSHARLRIFSLVRSRHVFPTKHGAPHSALIAWSTLMYPTARFS
jgi:hypothetical protein